MTDSGTPLTVDRQGFVYEGTLRLDVRYEEGALEFVVKDKRQWAEHGKRRKIPLSKFEELKRRDRTKARPTRKLPLGEFRAMERSVARRNNPVDKPD